MQATECEMELRTEQSLSCCVSSFISASNFPPNAYNNVEGLEHLMCFRVASDGFYEHERT